MIVTSTYKLKIGTTKVHFAVKVGSGEWSSLESAYLQPYNSLASLASALGGFQRLEYISDADTLGLYEQPVVAMVNPEAANLPTNEYGIVVFIPTIFQATVFGIELYATLESSNFYFRLRWNNWTSWIQL